MSMPVNYCKIILSDVQSKNYQYLNDFTGLCSCKLTKDYQIDDIMGYLICDTCNDVYKLQDGESPEEFDTCQCGGNLEYYETLQDFVSQFYDLSNFKSEDGNLLLKKGYNQLNKKKQGP